MSNNLNTPRASNKNWYTDALIMLVGLLSFYALFLGSHALLTPDEARYSEIARAMLASHDFITPRLNGTVFLDKPILYYWLQASAIKLGGLNEWALRFWPMLIGVFGCILVYASGRVLFNRRTGIVAALILSTSPLYFGMAHYANLDLEVAVLISSALLSFIVAARATPINPRWLYGAYSFAGLAILTKGLIGIVLPMLIIGLWILLLGHWQLIKQMRLISGLCLTLLIALPWYLLVQHANPQFFAHFFLNQQFNRFLSHDFNNAQPGWFYLVIILIGMLPWSGWLLPTARSYYKLVKTNYQPYASELFLVIWSIVVLCFFSIPHSKTIGYITPIVPPLALLIARYFDQTWQTLSANQYRKSQYLLLSLLFITAIIEISLLSLLPRFNLPSIKPLAIYIQAHSKPADEVVAYHKYYQDLPLYTQRRITVVGNWDTPAFLEGDNWHRELSDKFRDPAAHQWLIMDTVFWQRWYSKQRLFVLVNQPEQMQFLQKAGRPIYQLAATAQVNLYSNQAAKF